MIVPSTFYFPNIIFNISISVAAMPTLPSLAILFIVSSKSSIMIPSPPLKLSPANAISPDINAACTAFPIFAAHDDFAPSHTVPPSAPNVLVNVKAICSLVPPFIYVIAAPAADPADIAPQNAERLPIPRFRYIAKRFANASDFNFFSSSTFNSFAYSTTGSVTVIP